MKSKRVDFLGNITSTRSSLYLPITRKEIRSLDRGDQTVIMPYLAMRPDGKQILPLDVEADETVRCPLCEDRLRLRRSHYNRGSFVSRHFVHPAGSSCSGESNLHAKLKTIAAMKLRELFTTATVEHEKKIPGTNRIADVVATFDEPIFPFGKGIVVEVQHKNHEKEIGAISGEVLSSGYSVYWAYQSDFDGHDMTFAEHRVRTTWPDAIPLTEGTDGYADCVQQLLDPEPVESVELEIPIPAEYFRAHALEVIPPLRGYYREGQSPEGWEKSDSVSIHGKGRERAWVNVLRSPSNHIFLEFWKKDTKTSKSEYLIVHIGSEFPQRFEEFMGSTHRWFEADEASQQEDHWIPGGSLSFRGTTLCESWMSIAKVPSGPVKIIVGRRDKKGNTRTWSVDYRKGDLGRLAALRQPIQRIFGPLPSDEMGVPDPGSELVKTGENLNKTKREEV